MIIITILTLIVGIKAKAIEMVFEKPGAVSLYLWNNPNDHTQGSSVLTKEDTQITQLIGLGQDTEISYFMGQYWDIMEYNVTNRFNGMYIWMPSRPMNETLIWEFTVGWDIDIIGDSLDLDVSAIAAETRDYDNNTTEYKECGIVDRELTQRTTTVTTALFRVKCILEHMPQNVFILFEPRTSTQWNRKFWLQRGMTMRTPVSNEELLQVQKEIQDGIEYQNGVLFNAFGGTYDTTPPNETYYNYVVNKENEIMEELENINNVMSTTNIDTNAHLWVWDKITTILNTRSYIMGLYVTVLTIGIIKLTLGR